MCRTLLTWQRSTIIPAGLARRARLLVLLADGMTITEAAATVGLSRRHTYKWIQRFVQAGLEGLADKPGRGQRPMPRQYPLTEPDDLFA
jgi:hypothetical protein